MKREGLLTKLATGLPEWPDGEVRNPPKIFGEFRKYPFGNNEWSLVIQGELFTRKCWLDKRRRLINKPSWDDAPASAEWLAQDEDGTWCWYQDKPVSLDVVWAAPSRLGQTPIQGALPAGHDWRATLEQRPTDLTLAKGEGMTSTKTTAEKIKVMQAYLSGETLEATTGGVSSWVEWGTHSEPSWNWEMCDYRVKEEDYTLDIPWELIQEDWKWAVMDGEGVVWLTEKEPRINSQYNIWLPNGGVAKFFLKISTPDTKHWDKTLTKRPEGV